MVECLDGSYQIKLTERGKIESEDHEKHNSKTVLLGIRKILDRKLNEKQSMPVD